MKILNKLSIFLFLAVFLFSSARSDDDFVECLSHMNSSVIYTPNNSSYSTILSSYLANPRFASASNANKPAVILTPLDASQIQDVVRCSRIHDLQIRVRSGGHDYEGFSFISENPFVVIDLINMRSISIDTSTKTAWVQAGATLGELYYSIATKTRTMAFTAGTCPTVGVGGHFSGGGYGMLSRKFGLASDNILDATIIDSNGRILDRKSMGEDLFWAIRGGGGASFGIIVSWKIKLQDIPEKLTVFKVTRSLEQNATQLVHKWQHIAHKIDDSLVIRVFITASGKTFFQISFVALYIGEIKKLLPIMHKSFPELGLLKEDCIEMSWIQSVIYIAESLPDGASADILLDRTTQIAFSNFKGKSDFVQHIIPMDALKDLWKRLRREDYYVQLGFSPYGGKLSHYSESETPFPHRDGNLFMIHYGVVFSKKKEEMSAKLYRYMSRFVCKSPRAAYVNYRDLDLGVNNKLGNTSYAQASIWGIKYFKNNFKRLVQVKTKVDPTNFFRNDQSIPPLSKHQPIASSK